MLSVSACLLPPFNDAVRLLCRWVDRDGVPAFSSYGVHELCVRRVGSSLQFDRLSMQTHQPKLWLAIFFRTWESQSYTQSHIVSRLTSHQRWFSSTTHSLPSRLAAHLQSIAAPVTLSSVGRGSCFKRIYNLLHYQPNHPLIIYRRIIDDGFEHVLTVYEDKVTDGIRLFATVRGGSLKRTPVWTAFGTDAFPRPQASQCMTQALISNSNP